MANEVHGIRRMVALVSAMSVLGLTAPAAVQAEPAPPPPSPDMQTDLFRNASTPAEPDDGYGLGVALIGVNAWVAVTNQSR